MTYVVLTGTEPLLPFAGGSAPFDLRDLGGGIGLGVVCGVLARLGAGSIGIAKRLPWRRRTRLLLAVVGMVALAPVAAWAFGASLQLGPSYEAVRWAAEPQRTIGVLCGLFCVRAVATWLAVAGGGMGGLFIPLVTQGAIVGTIFERIVDSPNPNLFPTVGIAAFLGAGYRTPLAGVAFVAEATGEPGFLVPALLAASAAQLVMGSQSFSSYQRTERRPNVEPLADIPVLDIMTPNADTIDADLALDAVVTSMLQKNRRWAPVLDRSEYLGLIAVTDIARVPRDEWALGTAREVARRDIVPISPTDSLAFAIEQMQLLNTEALAVVADRRVVGVVTRRDVSNVTVLLDRLSDPSG